MHSFADEYVWTVSKDASDIRFRPSRPFAGGFGGLHPLILSGLDACFLGVFTRLIMVTCAKCLLACLACVKQRGPGKQKPNTCFVELLYPVPSLPVADDGSSSLFSSPSPLFLY